MIQKSRSLLLFASVVVLALPLKALAESPDSVGKPVTQLVFASLITPGEGSIGKPSSWIRSEGPPPAGRGLGFIFDTRKWFYVYSDGGSSANHYAPSGWMGDYSDIRLDERSAGAADGSTCMRVQYLARGTEGYGWAGVYWQEPRGNWGNSTRGYNLSGVKRVTFWARGQAGGEKVAVFKVGGIQGLHPDTGSAEIGPIVLSRAWTQYEIATADVDLKKVAGGFCWAASETDNTGPITFFLDEIRYER